MDYDVIVVGAGPAGSCAAYLLAEKGLAVALIDAERFPRPKCCAGWVNALAVKDFPWLDAVRRKVKAAPFRKIVFRSSDFEHSASHGSRSHLGYVVRRDKFDAELVRAAQGVGAEPVLGHKAVAIAPGERQVEVRLDDDRTLRGRVLVGADGVHSDVARMMGLRDRWPAGQLVHCLARQVPMTSRQIRAGFDGGAELHVSLGFAGAPGYAWAFPGSNYANIGVGARGQEAAGRLKDMYEQWVTGLREAGVLSAKAKTSDPCGAAVPAGAAIEFENHVGKRTVLIGDAGGFAAAASGEGIYPGMTSAAVAVGCIRKALAADAPKKAGTCQDELQKFRPLWRQKMAPYLQMPNVNVSFLLPLIFTNQEIADRFGRAFLFGENL